MVDVQIVCCMCGDVGFSDKLFRCTKCLHRFQHSYCSNYYDREASEPVEECDWCQSEERSSSSSRSSRHIINNGNSNPSSSKSSRRLLIVGKPEYSSSAGEIIGDQMKKVTTKRDDDIDGEIKGSKTTAPSPSRPSTRRYKLLKDVMS